VILLDEISESQTCNIFVAKHDFGVALFSTTPDERVEIVTVIMRYGFSKRFSLKAAAVGV
jgi:hypothetical protein